jgi:carbon-monoxide dehydrogenase large subunit
VNVVLGDTDLCPYGLGGWGSRSTAVATGAILKAAEALKKKILAISEHLIEVPPEDLVIERGRVHAVGSEKPAVSLAEVARVAYVRTLDLPPDIEPGLTATSTYDPPGLDHRPDEHGRMNGGATYTNHSHAAVVRVQLETGEVEVLDYIVVHDCGRVINPLIVEGQIHGGVAQGLGGALYEQMVYGADGQPLTTTFMDYLVPSSLEVPPMLVEHLESPAPEMPLGVKGVGEGGTIGPLAAVANAVASALSDFGIDITATPITPTLIRRMLRRSTGDSQWQEPLHA